MSVVIVSYNRLQDLEECIQSIHSHVSGRVPYEVVVVDNASSGDCRVICELNGAVYVPSGTNLGVSGGRNLGVEYSRGKVLLFIDDDALIETDCFDEIIINSLIGNIGILAFRILNAKTRLPHPGELPFSQLGKAQDEKEARLVSYFVGAGFAARKEVFRRIGGFREEFFYGVEELEYAFRILRHGWTIAYQPNIMILHKKSNIRITKKTQYYYLVRNRFMLACDSLPFPYYLVHLAIWSAVLGILAARDFALQHWFQGLRDGISYWIAHRDKRQPVSQEVIRYLRRHKGRLWF